MKVYYDDEVNALYIKLSEEQPDGVVEISEDIHIDTGANKKVVGIEILNASERVDLKTFLTYTLEFEKDLLANYS